MTERGIRVIGEGGDGVGKTTQVNLADEYYRTKGYETLRVRNPDSGKMEPVQEPGGHPEADKLRQQIKYDDSLTPWEQVVLLTRARRILWNEVMQPALEEGKLVFGARSDISTTIYQGRGFGVPIDEIEQYTREQVGKEYMTPDLVVIFAIKNEIERRKRLKHRLDPNATRDVFETQSEEFQVALRDGYIELAEERGYPLIDAARSVDVVFNDFRHHIDDTLRRAA